MEPIELISTLEFDGMELEPVDFFVNLASNLAKMYYNFFSNERIESLYSNLLSLENTKLSLDEILNYKDNTILNVSIYYNKEKLLDKIKRLL